MTLPWRRRPGRRVAVAGLLAMACALALLGCDSSDPHPEPGRTGGGRLMAIIGDSYMSGDGVPTADLTMAVKLADQLDMKLANFAVGGTGYLNPGMTGPQTYDVQAASALATDADLYLIEGGTNDFATIYTDHAGTITGLALAARKVFGQLVAEADGSDVIVVGPFWPYLPLAPGILEIRDALKKEAEAAGLPFIDPIAEGWLDPETIAKYIGPDSVHPNAAGEAYFADKLEAAINDVR